MGRCRLEMSDIERLLEVAKERKALLFGDFTLSSGAKSNYYFDGRLLTLDPEGSFLTAKCLLPILYESKVDALAGPTLGADPIVSSVSTMSYIEGKPVPALIVRKEKKTKLMVVEEISRDIFFEVKRLPWLMTLVQQVVVCFTR